MRIVPVWNSLPEAVVASASVEQFKRLLSNIDLTNFLKRDWDRRLGCDGSALC